MPLLLALIFAYLRVTQFDRSIPFALAALVLALGFAYAAEVMLRRLATRPSPAHNLGAGVFAAASIAALALALTFALERGYLTVAFALAALGAAYVATRRDIPVLRYAVAALGLIVLARVAIDPRIMGANVGTTPVLNWLLLGYGVPAVSFAIAANLLRRRGADLAVRLADGLAVLFAALLAFYQIRHALSGGDPLKPASNHVEQGLLALTSLGFSYVLSRLDLARANVVFRCGRAGIRRRSRADRADRSRRRREPAVQPRRDRRTGRGQHAGARLPAAGTDGDPGGACGAGRAAAVVRDGYRRARRGAAVRLRDARGAPCVPGPAHRLAACDRRRGAVGVFPGLAGAGSACSSPTATCAAPRRRGSPRPRSSWSRC